ncbi:hypothetical protein B0H13DRAFT_1852112 [Mycena leptocephala]|nr:hypothetical protein B0H13DRAFT_1852112 [Mycena leptocephala]
MYSETLSSFTSGALAFSLATTARERLATEMEGGAIPAEILRAIHVPPYKPAVILGDAGTAGLKADMIAMRDMLVVSQMAAATFLLACHHRTVKLLTGITNVDTVSAGFKTKLSDIVRIKPAVHCLLMRDQFGGQRLAGRETALLRTWSGRLATSRFSKQEPLDHETS